LVDTNLIEKRAQNEQTASSLDIYYQTNIFIQTLFDEGVSELLEREKEVQDIYDSSA